MKGEIRRRTPRRGRTLRRRAPSRAETRRRGGRARGGSEGPERGEMPKNKPAAARGFLDRGDLDGGASRLTAGRDDRVRRSKDAAVPFGTCFLSLAPLRDPVVSPSGHWYSREAMLEYMLAKKREIEALQAAFDEQQQNLRLQEQQARKDAQLDLEDAARRAMELGSDAAGTASAKDEDATSDDAAGPTTGLEKRKRDLLAGQARAHKRKKVDLRSRQEKLLELSQSSPWLARFAPEAKAGTLQSPPKRPPSPVTGAGMRMKDLAEFDLVPDPAEPGHALCAVSQKRIGAQPAILLRPSRAVVTKAIFLELVKPTMVCPLSGRKLEDSDILVLASPASQGSS